MLDSTLIIQLLALLLFAVCLYHAATTEGPRAAQQWFLVGYVFALLLISLLVITGPVGQIAYHPAMLVFGAAPSLTIMLFPAVFYLAYTFAQTFADVTDLRAMAYLIFLLTPALLLPLDATALHFRWWSFPSDSHAFLNGIPFYLPFAWGLMAATFYLMVGRIRRIRLRGNGQFFAMMVVAPLVVLLDMVLIAILQVSVNVLWQVGGAMVLYGALALLFFVLPLGLMFNLPRLGRMER